MYCVKLTALQLKHTLLKHKTLKERKTDRSDIVPLMLLCLRGPLHELCKASGYSCKDTQN